MMNMNKVTQSQEQVKLSSLINNCIELSGRWVPGMSRGLHCDQPAPRQSNVPMASNPCNPVMSPHTGTFGHASHCDNSEKKIGGIWREAEK